MNFWKAPPVIDFTDSTGDFYRSIWCGFILQKETEISAFF